MLMSSGIFVLLAVIRVEASPIRPDIRKVLSQPRYSAAQFGPARAGWNGPEASTTAQVVNPTYEQLNPAATARSVHNSLIAAALPDYRALAAIALIILLLRRMQTARRKAIASAALTPTVKIHTVAAEQVEHVEEDRIA